MTLPKYAAFGVGLEISSGRIRIDFPVLGDLSNQDKEMRGKVNGVGFWVHQKASSGDMALEVRGFDGTRTLRPDGRRSLHKKTATVDSSCQL